jgi:type IV pilus assembly protein PilN
MIKVNLLAVARREPVKRAPTVSTEGLGTLQNLGIIVLLLVAGGYVGWKYYSLTSQQTQLDAELADAQERMKKVEEDRRVADELEKKRQKVEHQIELITKLKNEQQVPVRLLDEISRNLPDFLWLTAMTEVNGQLTFTGKATTPTAYANFYNNLDASPYFEDVGKIQYRDEGAGGVSFSLSAKFVPSPQKKGAAEAPASEGTQ